VIQKVIKKKLFYKKFKLIKIGFIYYNELLYYFYKQSMLKTINAYPEDKLEKKDKAIEILRKEELHTKKRLKRIK
jgi:hypothetical protein